jgi:hypothetical protein
MQAQGNHLPWVEPHRLSSRHSIQIAFPLSSSLHRELGRGDKMHWRYVWALILLSPTSLDGIDGAKRSAATGDAGTAARSAQSEAMR